MELQLPTYALRQTMTVWFSDFRDFPALSHGLTELINVGFLKVVSIYTAYIVVSGFPATLRALYRQEELERLLSEIGGS